MLVLIADKKKLQEGMIPLRAQLLADRLMRSVHRKILLFWSLSRHNSHKYPNSPLTFLVTQLWTLLFTPLFLLAPSTSWATLLFLSSLYQSYNIRLVLKSQLGKLTFNAEFFFPSCILHALPIPLDEQLNNGFSTFWDARPSQPYFKFKWHNIVTIQLWG